LVRPSQQQAMWSKPHNFVPLAFRNYDSFLAIAADLYKKGQSLSEIATQVDLSKTKVRDLVLRAGVPLRPLRDENNSPKSGAVGKRHAKPPYGFAYFDGKIVKHPKEYTVLLSIIRQWKLGRPLNSIATKLNDKRVPSPMSKKWSWNSIANIVQRIKTKQIIQKGDHYELR
jgi:hypothetical protein